MRPTALSALLLAAALPSAVTAREIYVSNEKGNTVTILDGDSLAVVDWVDELEPVAPVEAVVDLEVLAPPVDVHDAKKVAPQAIARTARDRWLMRSPR